MAGSSAGGDEASKGDRVAITFDLPRRLGSADARLVEEAAGRYGDFLGADVVMR